MKVKVNAGSKITEPGYYDGTMVAIEETENRKNHEEPMIAATLVLDYDGIETEYVDRMYAAVSATSKLCQLAAAVGYAADCEAVVSEVEKTGDIDLNPYRGQPIRAHFDMREGGGRRYCTLVGYLAPKRRANYGDIPAVAGSRVRPEDSPF